MGRKDTEPAKITDIQSVIDDNGKGHLIYEVNGDSVEGIQTTVDTIRELHGGKEPEYTGFDMPTFPLKDNRSSSRFGFSSKRWNSKWEPKGPKKNWGSPPKDPSRN